MNIQNITKIHPSLRTFIFESRKMVLKNTYGGFSARIFCKSLDGYYQYITKVPNASNGNKPVDFLNCMKKEKQTSYIIAGELVTEMPIEEFNDLYRKIEKLIDLEGYMDLEKLSTIYSIYYENPFSELTVQKMILLHYLMEIGFQEDSMSKFLREFDIHCEATEMARRARLEAAIQAPEVVKELVKSPYYSFDKSNI